jgi:hypothetical protein
MRLDGGYLRVPKARELQRGLLKDRLTLISSANWEKWESFEVFFFCGSSSGNSLTMSNLSAYADVSLPRRRCENLSELRDRLRFSDAFLAPFDTRAGTWNVSVLVCDVGIPETRVLIMEASRAGVIDARMYSMYAALEYERLQYVSQSLERKVQVMLKGHCLKNS